MSQEMNHSDLPAVDEMRLREIQTQYDDAMEWLDKGGMFFPNSVDAELGLEGEQRVFDTLLMDMVPEMLQELGMRLRREAS